VKKLVYAMLFLAIATTAHAQFYKWTDENGTTHFSDKPHSNKAKAITVKPNGVTYHAPSNQRQRVQTRTVTKTTSYTKKAKAPKQRKIISADDYKISTSVGKLGSDVMHVSGRVGKGPVCKDMEIRATARNENGLSASVSERTHLSTSGGSTTFEGSQKVYGSAEDRSFWDVTSVTVTCYD
jgi:hypothetical protein